MERYLDAGPQSLTSDAPGWGRSHNLTSSSDVIGPTCWKCKGLGYRKTKKCKPKQEVLFLPNKPVELLERDYISFIPSLGCSALTGDPTTNTSITRENIFHFSDLETGQNEPVELCTVCHGHKSLKPKMKDIHSRSGSICGRITCKRRAPQGWKETGPPAYALQQMKEYIDSIDLQSTENSMNHPLYLLYSATHSWNSMGTPVVIPAEMTPSVEASWREASWLPTSSGEELCNLVGSWRILQRAGSHRWTTDDLVTAYRAQAAIKSKYKDVMITGKSKLNYLDLGCGNGSVLQMVLWALVDFFDIQAFGVEARSEAVGLARRSLLFNLGTPASMGSNRSSCQAKVVHHDFRNLCMDRVVDEDLLKIKSMRFHLITGTPPYFRVDFSSHGLMAEPKAVINQGGMPTSAQSAPARCEFRGGIEAYCEVASSLLSDDGIFVVCENWLNIPRVYDSASKQDLEIISALPVRGKEGKKENLFGVFVMRKNLLSMGPNFSHQELDPLVVRTEEGCWTAEYQRILEEMSIAVFSS